MARSPLDLFAAAVALLLPLAYAPGLEGEAWTGRSAILLLVIAVGLPLLWTRARGPAPLAPRCAIAFLVIGLASAVLSSNHTTAVFGIYNQGTGLLFMASLAAGWAIGLAVSPRARPLLESALIAGVMVNVAVTLGAHLMHSSVANAWFDTTGRSQALAGNPVHLAALTVLGMALVIPRFAIAPARWAVPVAALAATIQLSGTRLALVVMLALVVWAARRHGKRLAALLAVLVVLGLAAGTAIGSRGNASATQRASEPGGLAARPATWLSARHAIAAHLLLGSGPGQFRSATSRYRPASVALAEGSDRLFTDAHNLFVEYATTTGLLGVGALTLWLVAAIRPARGWLLVAAMSVLAIHLAEPQSVVTTPLAFLALGAAGPRLLTESARKRHRIQRVLPAAGIATAVVAVAFFVVGEFDLAQGQLDLRSGPSAQANTILPAWPRTASLLARVDLFDGIVAHHAGPELAQSRAWRLTAIRRDATDPSLWNDLAEFDESQLRAAEARQEFLSALRFNPTSGRALAGLERLAGAACDHNQAALWHRRFLAVTPPPLPGPTTPARSQRPAPACGSGTP